MSCVSLSHGRLRIHSTYVRMTPYSPEAAGSFSSRASSRSTALRASSGSVTSFARFRSSVISACSGSASPSSSWIAFSCWRRKYSRWVDSISETTWFWIFEPSSATSSSRLRITSTARRRFSTSSSSSSCCFSSVFRRSVEATRWQSALGSSTLAAASASSSGRYGMRPISRAKSVCTFCESACVWGVSSYTSGTSMKRPTRYGSSWSLSISRMRRMPWTRMRSDPSGTRSIFWTTAAAPISCRSSQPGCSTSESFDATSATSRFPATTSSTSRTERSCPIASGRTESGKTTVSLSGRTGSSDGSSTSSTSTWSSNSSLIACSGC